MGRRRLLIGLGAGFLACAVYLLAAVLTYHAAGALRPLYEGPCPPTTCPPCPPTCPSYNPYTPPPAPPPSSNPPPPPPPAPKSSAAPPPGVTPATQVTPSAGANGTGPPPTAGLIGAGGGSATASDGQLEVIVPAGAVTAPTVFDIRPLKASPPLPSGRQAATAVWDVTATQSGSSIEVFNRPLRFVFHVAQPAPLVIATWDGAEWVNAATSIDPAGKTATASLPHLTPVVAFTSASAPFVQVVIAAALPVLAIVFLALGIAIVAGTTAYVRSGRA